MIAIGWLLIAAYWIAIFLVIIWEPRDDGRWR